jgi:hypothetical protein
VRRALGLFGLNLYGLALLELVALGYVAWRGRIILHTRAFEFLLAGDLVLTVGAVFLVRSLRATAEGAGWRWFGLGAMAFAGGFFLLVFDRNSR